MRWKALPPRPRAQALAPRLQGDRAQGSSICAEQDPTSAASEAVGAANCGSSGAVGLDMAQGVWRTKLGLVCRGSRKGSKRKIPKPKARQPDWQNIGSSMSLPPRPKALDIRWVGS